MNSMLTKYKDVRRWELLLILVIILITFILLFLYLHVFFSPDKISNELDFGDLDLLKLSSNTTQLGLNAQPKIRIILPSFSTSNLGTTNVLSSLQFLNSPFLNLESLPSNTIPIIVLSKASNVEIRDAVRRTWAFQTSYRNDSIRIQVFFLVGIDDFMIKRIHAEQTIFSDIIQVSVPETDSFLAHKELAAMVWVRTFLPKSSFYIKTEDQVILNIEVFINKFLPVIQHIKAESSIIGWFGAEHIIKRGVYQRFVEAVLPPLVFDLNYAMIFFYVVTSSAADRMINAISHISYIEHPGDPFVTGILRDAAQVEIRNLAASVELYMYEISNGACRTSMEKNPKLLFCVSPQQPGVTRSTLEFFDTWDLIYHENK